ncbi:MAG: hypothetical protein HQL68_06655 [Magnetococcales bacterium]|nr:hypothetical protein [Magnetococcales bacterium]
MSYLVLFLLSAVIAIAWLEYSLTSTIADNKPSTGHQSLLAIIVGCMDRVIN